MKYLLLTILICLASLTGCAQEPEVRELQHKPKEASEQILVLRGKKEQKKIKETVEDYLIGDTLKLISILIFSGLLFYILKGRKI